MENKICTVCKIEKHINNFYKKYSECKACNIKRSTRRNYEKKRKKIKSTKIIL